MFKKKRKKALLLTCILSLSLLILPVSARSSCEGVVTASSLNIRSGAGMDYALLATVQRGTTLTVIGIATENSNWFKVNYNGIVGYLDSSYIINSDSSEAAAAIAAAASGTIDRSVEQPVQEPLPQVSQEVAPEPVQEVTVVEEQPIPAAEPAPVAVAPAPEDTIFAPVGASNATIKGDTVRFRATPGGDIMGSFRNGTRIFVDSVSGVWAKVNCDGTIGYVNGNYVTMDRDLPVAGSVAVPVVENTPAPVSTPSYVSVNTTGGQAIVDTAMQFLGVPYVWGGTSPSGFDCSGLCYYVYSLQGYSINRVAQSIYTGSGVSVGYDQLAVGDIICFGNSSYVWHVGIYVGNGQFIHAPNTGAVVRVEALSGNYLNNFVCAKRIV